MLSTSERVTQRRLKSLTDKKLINRERISIATEYHYFLKKVGQLKHSIDVTWTYVWFTKTLKSWEKLYLYELEQDCKVLRCDSIVGIKDFSDSPEGELKLYFVEMEEDSSNLFKKIKLYNELFELRHELDFWWKGLSKDFPSIIIVTETYSQLKLVKKKLKVENKHNLKFGLYCIEQIKEEARCGS